MNQFLKALIFAAVMGFASEYFLSSPQWATLSLSITLYSITYYGLKIRKDLKKIKDKLGIPDEE